MFRPISQTATARRLATRARSSCFSRGGIARGGTVAVGGQARSLASVVIPKAKDPAEHEVITTLGNGIRVTTEDLPDAFSGMGVYIDAGSRYENDYLRGASHIMDRLAFKSTAKRSGLEMMETIEQLGGNIQCASSRESMMYQAATFNSATPAIVELMAETIQNPLLTDEEIEQQLATAEYEVKEIWSKPELILPELVHTAAFKDNTLGNPLLCPQERLQSINRDVIKAYRNAFYRPERVVVAFAGVKHDEAVRLCQEYFGGWKAPSRSSRQSQTIATPTGSETSSVESLGTGSASESELGGDASSVSSSTSSSSASYIPPPSSSAQGSSKILSKIPFFKNLSTSATNNAAVLSSTDAAAASAYASSSSSAPTLEELRRPAHYTGGFLSLPNLPVSPNPNIPNFTHIYLAFEGLPISDDDIYALATLQTLLGGGGSFSAGGPGKGMYSRLYTNVLNQHGWVESCVAFNHSYTDSGLFGIAASCYPGRTAHMLEVMCRELCALTLDQGSFAALDAVEVARAKNQLRSSLLMNLESRMVELEDLGRQVQVHGRKVPVGEMTRRIADLSVADLRRVARRVLSGLVDNPGRGSGAPTVVLQEADAEGGGGAGRPLSWDAIQDIVYKWKLGKR